MTKVAEKPATKKNSVALRVAVVNTSGNVGKSTVARHLLLPRMPGAEFIAVESINADEGSEVVIRGEQFGALSEELMLLENAIIDVGASNIEAFFLLMKQYRGSHEDIDLFVVPVVKDSKQIKDTISTIQALKNLGVPASKIRVVFNKLETTDTVEDAFYPILQFHEHSKAFDLRKNAAIEYSELFHKLRRAQKTIPELIEDQTDYKALARSTSDPEERQGYISMVSMRRLAHEAQENLDKVFAAIIK